jgi:hypothetical protein
MIDFDATRYQATITDREMKARAFHTSTIFPVAYSVVLLLA